MSWKRMSITIFLLIVFLNILQINIFLVFVFNSQPPGDSGSGLSSDTISSIWFGEMLLGLILLMVGTLYFIISKKRQKTQDHGTAKIRSIGNVSHQITLGFNHISPFYKVDIENKPVCP